MRKAFVKAMLHYADDPGVVFLTGDLGFMALEPLRDAMGERFLNCGIAEQNMISVAAGLARTGFSPWAYSIAPFIYARPFEQVRNDVCFNGLPVRLVGNGGGFAYGVQGPTHHALEDCAAMGILPGMQVFAPAFDTELEPIVRQLRHADYPAYLRLGYDELNADMPLEPFAPWRKVLEGEAVVVLTLGPLAAVAMKTAALLSDDMRPLVWRCAQLPLQIETMPDELLHALKHAEAVIVMEEHAPIGALGDGIARLCMSHGILLRRFRHLHAESYPTHSFGSQCYHREHFGLEENRLAEIIKTLHAEL